MMSTFKRLSYIISKTAMFYTVFITSPLLTFQVVATEIEGTTVKKNNTSKNVPLVINSQVKGSQEQPNVIYIMPWQGINNPIRIEGNTHKIVLPHFKPINPKSFKKQARVFYKANSIKHKQSSSSK